MLVDLDNIILLHGALLPLNGLRLSQAMRLRAKIRDMAHAEYDVRKPLPFMSRFECKAGTTLFKRDEPARGIYYLLEGRVRIAELGLEVAPGQMIGEIAMFTPDKRRTQTAECLEDSVFMQLTEEKTLELYAENLEFGLYLTKMMVQRLLSNAERAPEAAVAQEGSGRRQGQVDGHPEPTAVGIRQRDLAAVGVDQGPRDG